MVRTLPGPQAPLRGGRNSAQGPRHQARKGRLHCPREVVHRQRRRRVPVSLSIAARGSARERQSDSKRHDLFMAVSYLHRSTLKVFRNGSPKDYRGTRKSDGIISYMQR